MLNTEIWNAKGDLVEFSDIQFGAKRGDVAAVIVDRDRPDLTDELVEFIETHKGNLAVDTYVIEMGSVKRSKYESIYYDDSDYRGKCYGHNVGLRYAKFQGYYRYYLVLMNDVRFLEPNGIENLVRIADKNPEIGILSPAEPEGPYPDCFPRVGSDFHTVSTPDYLALLIRNECVESVGFMNPSFKYCWGALHELSYKLYSKGWKLAYCDRVNKRHLGGTTYGKTKNTISRDDYIVNAKRFAADYFRKTYGESWDDDFSKVLPIGISVNTYRVHRRLWESV
jgi:GT2 family glycosyltransferase